MTSADHAKSRTRSPASERPTNAWTGAALGVVAALPALLWFRGFTVDDALISAGVAHRIATGQGYRFDAAGPVVDAVTPLGYAFVLAPFAARSAVAALAWAKALGAAAWLIAAALLGAHIARTSRRRIALAPLIAAAFCPALAAWSASGMETGLVTLFATLALRGGASGVVAAGMAAAWRPELIPWAAILAAGLGFVEAVGASPLGRALGALRRVAPVLGFPLVVALVRWRVFGHTAPLAVFAKPGDVEQGAAYSLAALLGAGPVWLLVAPRALARLEPSRRVMLVAAAVHFAAVALAGGDWMWLFRLAVPVLPSILLVGASIADCAIWPATLVRVLVACAAAVAVALPHAGDARDVGARRARLIDAGRRVLADARHVATVDVGWVGAAAPGASIVDLAGATDAEIAALPGSHTSKRIHAGLLAARGVDAMVLLLAPGARVARPWTSSRFARAVEARIAGLPDADGFAPAATLPLGGGAQDYLVVVRR